MMGPSAADRSDDEIMRAVRRVATMRLTESPTVIILDAGSIWSGDPEVAISIIQKLGVLANQEGVRVVVQGILASERGALETRIPRARLVLAPGDGPANLYDLLFELNTDSAQCLAILSAPGASVPDRCRAFYCGPGAAPARADKTREPGPTATNFILALYGTALAQERAGIAFRSVSQGAEIPHTFPFDPQILHGVCHAVEQGAAGRSVRQQNLCDSAGLRRLAHAAFDRLLSNLLPTGAIVGSPAQGKAPGEPNYWFYWQRDGAVTMRHLISWHRDRPLGLDISRLDGSIERYLSFVSKTQRHGRLGTSRYTEDAEPILGYGNPQIDGPALSALTLAEVPDREAAWPPLKRYLDFLLTSSGRGLTMDVWELVYGRMFNAEFLKAQALLSGAQVALGLGYASEASQYHAEADRLLGTLPEFIDPRTGRYIARRATYNPWFQVVSGLDIGVIAAYLYAQSAGARAAAHHPNLPFGHWPESLACPPVLATMAALEDAFASLYQVNRDWRMAGNAGAALGRFPEDMNDGFGSTGGNPWPLATLWGAQFYYRLAAEVTAALIEAGSSLVLVDPRQVAFFQRFVEHGLELGLPISQETWLNQIIPRLLDRGDAYLNFVVHHTPDDGAVAEQLDRDTGEPRGARDLSWALSELVATIALREELTLRWG